MLVFGSPPLQQGKMHYRVHVMIDANIALLFAVYRPLFIISGEVLKINSQCIPMGIKDLIGK